MSETFADILADTPLARRLERLREQAEAVDRHRAVVIVHEWGDRPVKVIGPVTDAERAEITAGLLAGAEADPRVLVINLRPGVSEMVQTLVSGEVRETCGLGARGDGKSVAGALAWLEYAAEHQARGGPLPVRILCPTTTFTEHKEKLCETLREPLWRGLWVSADDEHEWTASIGGTCYVELRLFGVKDPTEQDKMRAAAHGLWIEEAAPAGVEASGGLTEDALGLGVTSLRLPSYHHPVLVTSNYGSESHWTWQRYAVRQQPGTHLVRIPPGERASAEDRSAWLEALDGRPDLQRRLVHGEPALIVQGAAVLEGVWNPDVHVARESLTPIRGARTVIGHDTGLRPASVIVQEHRGQLRVFAALTTEYGGFLQHLQGVVIPWLNRHMPWLIGRGSMLEHRIDPASTTSAHSPSEQTLALVNARQN